MCHFFVHLGNLFLQALYRLKFLLNLGFDLHVVIKLNLVHFRIYNLAL